MKTKFAYTVAFFVAFVFGAAIMLTGFALTNMTSVHITNSQIDSTPIGVLVQSSAKFTSASASGGFTGNLTGNSTSASSVPWTGVSSPPYPVTASQSWQYAGQPGQPSWLWGTNDGNTMQVWNPAVFNVASATNATNATNAANATVAQSVTGLITFRTGATCTTGGGSYNTCSATFSVPHTYTNLSTWSVACHGISVSAGMPAIIALTPNSSNSFVYEITNGTNNGATASQFSGLQCMATGS